MREIIQHRVDGLLDEMDRRDTCDFVEQFAYPLPSLVIFDLLGLDPEDHDAIRKVAPGIIDPGRKLQPIVLLIITYARRA